MHLSISSSDPMKRYLVTIAVFFAVMITLCISVVIFRIVVVQPEVDEVFKVRPNTRLLCLGNSHTGCTWEDSESLGVQVLWKSSTPILFSVLRLRELERRGQLTGIKACIMDCDMTTVEALQPTLLIREFRLQLPFTWRYSRDFWRQLFPVFVDALLVCRPFVIQETPPRDMRLWGTLTEEDRRRQLKTMYGSEIQPVADWLDYVLKAIVEAKEICRRNGIHLYLMASPLVSNNPQQLSTEISELKQVARDHGVPYVDFRREVSDSKFRDAQHMSEQGRREFTQMMVAKLVEGLPL